MKSNSRKETTDPKDSEDVPIRPDIIISKPERKALVVNKGIQRDLDSTLHTLDLMKTYAGNYHEQEKQRFLHGFSSNNLRHNRHSALSRQMSQSMDELQQDNDNSSEDIFNVIQTQCPVTLKTKGMCTHKRLSRQRSRSFDVAEIDIDSSSSGDDEIDGIILPAIQGNQQGKLVVPPTMIRSKSNEKLKPDKVGNMHAPLTLKRSNSITLAILFHSKQVNSPKPSPTNSPNINFQRARRTSKLMSSSSSVLQTNEHTNLKPNSAYLSRRRATSPSVAFSFHALRKSKGKIYPLPIDDKELNEVKSIPGEYAISSNMKISDTRKGKNARGGLKDWLGKPMNKKKRGFKNILP